MNSSRSPPSAQRFSPLLCPEAGTASAATQSPLPSPPNRDNRIRQRRKDSSMTVERRRPLKIGLYIPNGDGPMGNGIGHWRDVLAMARRAEDVGFDSIW